MKRTRLVFTRNGNILKSTPLINDKGFIMFPFIQTNRNDYTGYILDDQRNIIFTETTVKLKEIKRVLRKELENYGIMFYDDIRGKIRIL